MARPTCYREDGMTATTTIVVSIEGSLDGFLAGRRDRDAA